MKTINIDGIDYVEKAAAYEDGNHVCVICTNGWIFEGHATDGSKRKLTDSHVVRQWSNGLGIGGLADPEHADEYTLDHIGCIEIDARAVIATITLRW